MINKKYFNIRIASITFESFLIVQIPGVYLNSMTTLFGTQTVNNILNTRTSLYVEEKFKHLENMKRYENFHSYGDFPSPKNIKSSTYSFYYLKPKNLGLLFLGMKKSQPSILPIAY